MSHASLHHLHPLCLHYQGPAKNWNEALPLGNGRLGGMVYSGARNERICLNEDSIWSGVPHDTINYQARQHLEEVRGLIFAGQYRQAQDIIENFMQGQGCEVYQTAGDLTLTRLDAQVEPWPVWPAQPKPPVQPTALWNGIGDEPHRGPDHDTAATDYRRGLDLADALSFSSYQLGGHLYQRSCIISAVDQVLAYRMETSGGQIDLRLDLACPLPHRKHLVERRALDQGSSPTLLLEGQCLDSVAENWKQRENFAKLTWDEKRKGVRFAVAARVSTDGFVGATADGKAMEVRKATWLTIFLAIQTDFSGSFTPPLQNLEAAKALCLQRLDTACDLGWKGVLERHLEEHRKLFGTMDLHLGSPEARLRNAAIPTDQRLSDQKSRLHLDKAGDAHGAAENAPLDSDADLAALLFQYGRYLLVSSSRPGTQAANLQGIWNPHLLPPWGSEYTTNINTQMNYWPAEPCNLAPCAQPLFTLVRELAVTGTRTAVEHYGTRGWCAHHNVDIWRNAAPVDGDSSWALWPMAGAWLSRHLWEHYLYSQDKEFLQTQAWPALSQSAYFLLDWLVETPSGTLGTCPSTSPENCFITPEGKKAAVSHSSTMDLSIIRDIFDACIQASAILGVEPSLAQKLKNALARLEPFRILADGRLAEWSQDFKEAEPGHRHVSHLYGIYPAQLFEGRDDLVQAARKTLEARLANGGGHTGWSCAWLINLWARLGDAEQAGHFVQTLLGRSTYPNLLDAHPPFQIDGNFGAAAGIAEMLLQSQGSTVRLLPACPGDWNQGQVRGIRARGAWELDFAWKDGVVTELKITNLLGEERSLDLELPGKPATTLTVKVPARSSVPVLDKV